MENITFKSLGTDISVQIISDDITDNLEKDIKLFYLAKEKIFSRFDENSELSQLNKKCGEYNPASSDIIEIVQKSLEYYEKTDGYFDPRIIDILENIGYKKDFKTTESFETEKISKNHKIRTKLEDDLKFDQKSVYFGRRMDFSGIVKGYITDQMALTLEKQGYGNVLVDSGGDIRIFGKNEQRKNWKISLEGFPEEKLLIELNYECQAVATSGITRKKWQSGEEKYHHLVNPKKPTDFSFDLKSVTVAAKNAVEADVWAKVLFLMGREKGSSLSKRNGLRSIFLDYKGNVWISEEMKKNINIDAK